MGAELYSATEHRCPQVGPSPAWRCLSDRIHTNGRRNVLPGTATLKGDARALTPATNATIEAHMRQIANGIAERMILA